MSNDQPAPVEPNPALERLRQQARERVDRTSLHAVAQAAEVTKETLRRFLDDGVIAIKAQSKLSRWLRSTERLADARARECVKAMTALVAELPERARMKGIRTLLDVLRSQYKHGVGAVPLWLDQVIRAEDDDVLDWL